ncbi:protein of unknown function DUF554 [Clostridium sp. DL-VIII]|uniref:DUF554 domain-containing protein n=1 Tax=Clostridium sp. DL-VIII TaxID=641107 RepID=UPI00023B0455|nr:DUF554 domain-containing protein [Clostridium sp. DL-VIII]EHJ00745.1 protein of unknown function DUF554 [Clostridium sp. DL-VIII]
MLGTIVNTGAIIIGTTAGCVVKKGINDKHQETLFNAMGFAATALGINAIVSHMSGSNYPVLFIVSLAVGCFIGSILNIDEKFQKVIGKYSKSNLGQGLSTGILLYCIGTLSILGPVMSAIYGDNTYLFTNATLDLVTSMVFASTYGIGMIFAAPILFMWQGGIYLTANFLSGAFFSDDLIRELSIVGGVLIVSSGISILKIKDCKTLNMLPSLFVPILFFILKGVIGF